MFHKQFDVVVCGAGVAGIAAAVKSARLGAKTCLIESSITLGGLATAGMVNIYLPLCDGNGNQILAGLAEELLKLSVKYGAGPLPPGWGGEPGAKIGRYMTVFSPGAFALSLDELLGDSGVDVWYDTRIIGAVVNDDGRLNAVEVANKSGRGEISAHAFVDATGDADLAGFAGRELRDGLNHLSIWAVQASMTKAAAASKHGDPSMLLDVVRLGANDRGEGHPEGAPRWNGVSGASVSEFVIASRRLLREHYAESANSTAAFPLVLPSMPQFRKTRMIVGEDNVRETTADSPTAESAILAPDWRTKGRLWAIPDGALKPKGVRNLFAAGRIISAGTDDAWDATRVIPVAAATGERAGELASARAHEFE